MNKRKENRDIYFSSDLANRYGWPTVDFNAIAIEAGVIPEGKRKKRYNYKKGRMDSYYTEDEYSLIKKYIENPRGYYENRTSTDIPTFLKIN